MTSGILNAHSSIEDESIRVVTAAANLIAEIEIRQTLYQTDLYPPIDNISNAENERLGSKPPHDILTNMVRQELKQVAIGHCIVQAARPHSVAITVLLATGVSLDECFWIQMATKTSWPGFLVNHALSDADTNIVHHALQLAAKQFKVLVVASDTDVLYEITGKSGGKTVTVPVREAVHAVGRSAANQVLCCHAISGCDTTSSLFGRGKVTVWRKLTGNISTLPLTEVMGFDGITDADVLQAGLQLLALIYGATDLPAAPENLLKVVRCKCRKSDTDRPCSSQLCSCRKYTAAPGVSACKNCNGQTCDNSKSTEFCEDCSDEEDHSVSQVHHLGDAVPDDCLLFDIPWLDEEVVD
ncbi:hypothetical protein Btru_077369 [Bulinus truncatus]|nr:hypothetical protein Btru_077369 [Bulinus truncatus]